MPRTVLWRSEGDVQTAEDDTTSEKSRAKVRTGGARSRRLLQCAIVSVNVGHSRRLLPRSHLSGRVGPAVGSRARESATGGGAGSSGCETGSGGLHCCQE